MSVNQRADIKVDLTVEEMVSVVKELVSGDVKRNRAFNLIASFVDIMSLQQVIDNLIVTMFANKTETGQYTASFKSAVASNCNSVFNTLISQYKKDNLAAAAIFNIYKGWGDFSSLDSSFSSKSNRRTGLVLNKELETLCNGLATCFDLSDVKMPTIFLYGPPGTGKSSLAYHIQEKSSCDIERITINKLMDKLTSEVGFHMERSEILIIDELDKLPKKLMEGKLTELLSFLDNKPKGSVYILTANVGIEEFPEPLLRPGRVDIIKEVGFLNKEDAQRLFKNLLPTVWEKAFQTYCNENGNPDTFQPSCIKAFSENVERNCVTTLVASGVALPKNEDREIGFIENARAVIKAKKNKKEARSGNKESEAVKTALADIVRRLRR